MWAEQMEKLLEYIQTGVHLINKEGITLFYNQKMAEIDGLNQAHVLGKNLFNLFPSLTEESSTLVRALNTGKEIREQLQTYVNFKGQQITSINRTYPLLQKGEIIGAVELAEDLTRVVQLNEQILELRQQLIQHQFKGEDRVQLVGMDSSFLHAIEKINRVARTDSTVLITGSTGTGKELVAKKIHQTSHRKKYPFIAQNCAAVPGDLLEGLLFGTVRGAFTGAINRPGLFEQAHKGTLFLDEINSLDGGLQAKLLRVLQDQKIRRLGGTAEFQTDVRIIAAMNTDPLQSVKKGEMRADFYYRLNVVTIHLPPLSQRKKDIPLLIDHFIQEFNQEFNRRISHVTSEALEHLQSYSWPGNVRELKHALEHAFNMLGEKEECIDLMHLPHLFEKNSPTKKNETLILPPPFYPMNLPQLLEEYEQDILKRTLDYYENNISKTAKALGMKRQALQYKMKKYGIRS
ncbi:MAG TPA: Fis family transcriptional regulator [Paenibacillaceae bacterium]|nr:Fis family transcriptional regulator [Paenibacillaceae bacterium]